MVTIVGFLIVVGSVLGGFMMAGGHVGALIHPSEIITIGGAALGALVVMSPLSVLKNLVKGIISTFTGDKYGKQAYAELFSLLYEIFRKARKDGLLAMEIHLSNPHESAIFQRYPRIVKNHHVTDFIKGALGPFIDGSVTPGQLRGLLDVEIHAVEEEHHAPTGVLSKTADALPGFGIVAAVLGIVITMEHINGPVEEIGHKVGAALVGTFLGILMSYGFIAPLVGKLEMMGVAESCFFRTIAAAVLAFVESMPPKFAIEVARRGIPSDVRPSDSEMEKMFKEAEQHNE